MKINEVSLTNFRNHHQTKIGGLERINYFLGYNGAGKSSIVDAIAYAITGQCRGVDQGGRGSEALKSQIPGGPKALAGVRLLTDRGEVLRAVGQGPKSQVHFAIQQKLGVDERFVRVVAAPPNLLKMERRKQEEIFLALTGAGASAEQVAAEIERLGLKAEIVTAEEILTREGRDYKLSGLKERRVALKREIDLQVVPPSDLPKADEVARRALEAKLAELRREQGQQEAQAAKARHISESIDRARLRLEAAGARAAQARADLLDPGSEAEVKSRLSEREEIARDHDAALTRRNLALQRMGEARVRGERIKTLGPKCGSCEQAIAAEFAKQALEEARAEYAKQQAAAAAEERVTEDLCKRMTAIDALRFREALSRHERAQATLAAEERAINEAQAEIRVLEAQAAPASQRGPGDSITPQIRALEAQIDQARQAEAEVGRALHINSQRQRLQDELGAVEAAIEAIGPGGPIFQMMVSGGIEEVLEQVRGYGEALGVGQIGVDLNPWQITLNGRPVELASASEEWRVAAAFGIAFAVKAKAGLVILDGAEILRGENRQRFQDLVFSLDLDQVFVAGAIDREPGQDYEVPADSAVFVVRADEKGVARVERLPGRVTA